VQISHIPLYPFLSVSPYYKSFLPDIIIVTLSFLMLYYTFVGSVDVFFCRAYGEKLTSNPCPLATTCENLNKLGVLKVVLFDI